MKNQIILLITLLIMVGCNDNTTSSNNNNDNTSWVFVANEGAYGASNGSISMIDDFGNVYSTDVIGDVVQSLEVYNDKLIVLINNSHKIKVYDITSEGLAMPGIEVSTSGSSPREMVIVNDNVYFTNWNTSDVKVFNLYTYNIDVSIPVGAMPEGIETDGTTIWVANSGEDTVSEIDIATNSVTATHTVGDGPQNLVINNSTAYISRTYYSSDWTITYHGASKIDGSIVTINNYGSGSPCGGSVLSYQNDIYRSFNGGLARLDSELNLNTDTIIGNFNQSQVYHVELIDENFWFALTDYQDMNEVHVIDSNGNLIANYDVGQNPGDFAKWKE
tara:strand:+ start:37 stop:1032 length:996 start_codon:yes stop_codon:yes gene_type:complete